MPVLVAAADLPGLVADRLAGRLGTRWVGIDGFGATGKTTLAAAVARRLDAPPPAAVPFPVREVLLVRSFLSHRGARHEPVGRYPLANPAGGAT